MDFKDLDSEYFKSIGFDSTRNAFMTTSIAPSPGMDRNHVVGSGQKHPRGMIPQDGSQKRQSIPRPPANPYMNGEKEPAVGVGGIQTDESTHMRKGLVQRAPLHPPGGPTQRAAIWPKMYQRELSQGEMNSPAVQTNSKSYDPVDENIIKELSENPQRLQAVYITGALGALASAYLWIKKGSKLFVITGVASLLAVGVAYYYYRSKTSDDSTELQTGIASEASGQVQASSQGAHYATDGVMGRQYGGMFVDPESARKMEQLQRAGWDKTMGRHKIDDVRYQSSKDVRREAHLDMRAPKGFENVAFPTREVMDNLPEKIENYNMDEAGFAEYMNQMEGYAPNQFHRTHLYVPNAANFEYESHVDDAETQHGISDMPREYARPYGIRDRKIQQAGADQSHLADPPPTMEAKPYEARSKVHPWMAQGEVHERRNQQRNGAAQSQERAMGRPSNSDVFNAMTTQKKISNKDIDSLRKSWEEQTKAISPMMARDNTDPAQRESVNMPQHEVLSGGQMMYPSQEDANIQRIFEKSQVTSANESNPEFAEEQNLNALFRETMETNKPAKFDQNATYS